MHPKLQSQTFVPNYDESKVPQYTLPNPLVFENGALVMDVSEWEPRRAEIIGLFGSEMYGITPLWTGGVHGQIVYENTNALGGAATMREVKLTLKYQRRELSFYVLFHIPNNRKPAPLFLGYNFFGNHTTTPDTNVRITTAWVANSPEDGSLNHEATAKGRNTRAARWPYEEIISRGYAVATIYYGEIDPDFDDGFHNGVHQLLGTRRDSTSWASVAAWAFGLSRALDYIETIDEINTDRVAVIGHSRLGKAALWAGALDERFAMVISNNSGCGGAALSRRQFGETVKRINTNFPHWFASNFKKYNDQEHLLPVDQHQLLALIAPRPLYVASAEDDRWADPKGEFLASLEASKVYRFMGLTGLPVTSMPAINRPVISGTIGYHIRPGRHEIALYDWQQYMNFADWHFR